MKETEAAEGVAPEAKGALASGMVPRFTVDEHSQRFKSKWNAGPEQVSLGDCRCATVFREYGRQEGVFVARKIPTIAGTCMEQEIAIMEKLAKGCENLVQLRGVVVASHDAG